MYVDRDIDTSGWAGTHPMGKCRSTRLVAEAEEGNGYRSQRQQEPGSDASRLLLSLKLSAREILCLGLPSALRHAALERLQLRVECLILLKVLEARFERATVELGHRIRLVEAIVDALFELG